MFTSQAILRVVLFLAVVAETTAAGHVLRYNRYTPRSEAIKSATTEVQGLDFLAKYVCSPCPTNMKRAGPSLNVPLSDLPSLYTELETLKAETINRMIAAGITPIMKRSILNLFNSASDVELVELPASDFGILGTYVCPSSCNDNNKRQTTVKTSIKTSITTNINFNVPPEQLQAVLDAIKRAIQQVEALLRSLGIPIPIVPIVPTVAPGAPAPTPHPAPPAPAPPTKSTASVGPPVIATPEPAPPASTPHVPAPPPTPTSAPGYTSRITSINTVTTTVSNGVVTTIFVTPTPSLRPPAGGGEDCPATVTVNSTTTITEAGAASTA